MEQLIENLKRQLQKVINEHPIEVNEEDTYWMGVKITLERAIEVLLDLKAKESHKSRESNIDDVINRYEKKATRPLKFDELCLILHRFRIMLEEEPGRYTVEEFIQQEDYRRDMFLYGVNYCNCVGVVIVKHDHKDIPKCGTCGNILKELL